MTTLAPTALAPDIQCVVVSALIPGHLYLPHREIFQDALENGVNTGIVVPTFSFLVEHSTKGRYLFDLGLRKHVRGYPPDLDDTLSEFKPQCDKDAYEILAENNVNPNDIQGIIFSHLHFDHTCDVELFPSAEIILGGEAETLLEKPMYPTDPSSPFREWPEGRSVRYIRFDEKTQTKPLSSSSPPFFNKSHDFFGDGSLILIDAPGHFPGHLAALARVGTVPSGEPEGLVQSHTEHSIPNNFETYVLLAGDCCHDRQCYTVVPPNRSIRQISEENHEDIGIARTTMVSLIHVAERLPNVVIILAHDREYEEEGIPLIPTSLNDWAVERVRQRSDV